jgi:hypothetical protein
MKKTSEADRLEIAGLMDRAVDRDGGFFDEMLAEAGAEPVHLFDDAVQVFRLTANTRSRVDGGEEFQDRQDGCH